MTDSERKLAADDAREYFEGFQLSYADVTEADAIELVALIEQQIKQAAHRGLTDIEMHVSSKIKFRYEGKTGRMKSLFTFIDSDYFRKREMVSFNEDGWIGFCGWASSKNEAPILAGFKLWCLFMAGKKAGGNAVVFAKGMQFVDEYGEGGYTYAECMECGSQFVCPEGSALEHEVLPHEYKCCPVCKTAFPAIPEELSY